MTFGSFFTIVEQISPAEKRHFFDSYLSVTYLSFIRNLKRPIQYFIILWECYFLNSFHVLTNFEIKRSKGDVIENENEQENPAHAVKPARHKSMQKLLQFDVFRFISPNSISPKFKLRKMHSCGSAAYILSGIASRGKFRL